MSADVPAPTDPAPTLAVADGCPRCGGTAFVPIEYGYPFGDDDLMALARRGEVELGGCVLSPEGPTRRCTACGKGWATLANVDPLLDPRHLAPEGAIARGLGIDADRVHRHLPEPLERVHLSLSDVDWTPTFIEQLGDRFVLDELQWFTVGFPALALIGAFPEACIVARPVVRWLSFARDDLRADRLIVCAPDHPDPGAWLEAAVTHTVRDRRAAFETCVVCGESRPPEWLHPDRVRSNPVCQSCVPD